MRRFMNQKNLSGETRYISVRVKPTKDEVKKAEHFYATLV